MIRIGYPCINLTLNCRPDKKFRLYRFSEKLFIETATNNLKCLSEILDFNFKNKIFFFRIHSNTIPFASHPINQLNWKKILKEHFLEISKKLKNYKIRVTMHPDHFCVLNSQNKEVLKRSISELIYHLEFLESIETSYEAKIQIHIGGAYNDKKQSIERFIENFKTLPTELKKRIVIENDERIYTLKDCLYISQKLKIPIVADYLHHQKNHNLENFKDIFKEVSTTWQTIDGPPIIDFSNEAKHKRQAAHATSIDTKEFKRFLLETTEVTKTFDVMLELKDKEKSAIKAIKLTNQLGLLR